MLIYHQKVIIPHKSVPYSPEQIIQPHLFNIFTFKHDLRTFVEKDVASRIYVLVWAKSLRMPGLGGGGGQPNLGNACILRTFGTETPP